MLWAFNVFIVKKCINECVRDSQKALIIEQQNCDAYDWVIVVIISSDNGLSPDRHQAIILIDSTDVSIKRKNTPWYQNRNSYIFTRENVFENVA